MEAYCILVYWKSMAYYPNKMKYKRAYDSLLTNPSGDQCEEEKIITYLKNMLAEEQMSINSPRIMLGCKLENDSDLLWQSAS